MNNYKQGEQIGSAVFLSELDRGGGIFRIGSFSCKCGNEFYATIADVKRGQIKSCGCRWSYKKDRTIIPCSCGCNGTLSSVDKRGRDRAGFIRGHNKGHSAPHSEATKEKCRIASTGKKHSIESRIKISVNGARGDKNINWKGGVTKESETIRKSVEYKLWREAVFQRDNFTCQECGEKESVSGKLNAHHVKPFSLFPELRLAIDNGKTLCYECHQKTDTYLWKCPKNIHQLN